MEGCEAATVAPDVDAAFVQLYQALAQGQAYPVANAAFGQGAFKTVEHLIAVKKDGLPLQRNTHARIGHVHHQPVFLPGQDNPNVLAGRRVFHGVGQQVEDYLFHGVPVGSPDKALRRSVQAKTHPILVHLLAEIGGFLRNERHHVYLADMDAQMPGLCLAEVNELLDHVAHAVGIGHDAVQVSLLRAGHAGTLFERLAGPVDEGQRIGEFVGYVGEKVQFGLMDGGVLDALGPFCGHLTLMPDPGLGPVGDIE